MRRIRSLLRKTNVAALALLGSLGCTASNIQDVTGDGVSTTPGASSPTGSGSSNTSSGTGTTKPGTSDGTNPDVAPGGPSNTPGGTGTTPGTGSIGTPGAPTTPGAPGGVAVTPIGNPPVDCATPGPRTLRRLSSTQYRNSLLAIFNNDSSLPSEDVLADPAINGFRIDADAAVVENLDAELLMNYAETIAEWAVAVPNRISSFTNNCTNKDDSNCRSQFVRNFGQRVQREPLSEERQKAYENVMKTEIDAGGSFDDGAKLVITALLQSPYLLYRRELGADSGSEYQLTPHEIASELAFFLTESPPDDELRKAAAEGRLGTQADIDKQVTRLLETDKAKQALKHFVHGWLEIENLPTKAKDTTKVQFDAALGEAMLRETDELFLDALFNGKDVSHLLTANYSFQNGKLGALYQLPGGSDAFQRVELTGTNRPRGILGHAAFLTMHSQAEFSSPVQRGKIVRERILCQKLPPVPADLNTNLDRMATFTTNRERYQQHSSDPVCATCHKAMDPVGFPFENYDEFGRYRSEEGGKPVDATGVLIGMPEGDIPLDGVDSVIDYLAQSDAVRSCLVRYWSYFAYGRDEWEQKICNQDYVRREAADKGYSLRSVLDGIIHAPHFTRRVKAL